MAKYIYSYIILCFISIANAESTPIIYRIVRNVGEKVDLACTANNSKYHPVRWIRYYEDPEKNKPFMPFLALSLPLVCEADTRYSKMFNAETNTYHFSIRNVRETDAGWYACTISEDNAPKLANITELKVRRPQILTDNSTSSLVASEGETNAESTPIIYRIVRNVGEKVDLACTANNSKYHPVRWIRYYEDPEKNKPFMPFLALSLPLVCEADTRYSKMFNAETNTYHFSIRNVRETDAGWYACTISEDNAPKLANITELKVRRPQILTDNSTSSLVASEGETNADRSASNNIVTQVQLRNVGDNVYLACSVDNPEDTRVLWIRYDEPEKTELSALLSVNSAILVPDLRYSINFIAETNTYNFSIRNIQETDAGWYQCKIDNNNGTKIAAKVEIMIRRPPVISDNSTRSLVVSEGESVKMECYASGIPKPTIHWRRENTTTSSSDDHIASGNVYKIAKVRKEDAGTYYCEAMNGGPGYVVTGNITLKVVVPDASEEMHRPNLIQVNETNSCKDHNKELHLITKEAIQKEMEHEQEFHQMRMTILELEKEYWTKKLKYVN